MTASPERAAYDADPWAPPEIPWEELFNEDKDKYRGIAQAVINASPELAGARARITAAEEFCAAVLAGTDCGGAQLTARTVLAYLAGTPVASPEASAGVIARTPVSGDEAARALLAAPVTYPGTDAVTVGELLAAFTIETWQAEPRLASYKTEVYLAAIRAGLIPGVTVGDRIGEVDITAAEALTEAAIRAMGQPQPLPCGWPDKRVTAAVENGGAEVIISAPPGTDPDLVRDMAEQLAANAHLLIGGRSQCCPMDTYDTDSAGDLQPVCTCDDRCDCKCTGCRCAWGWDDDV
jgi:hypothetical protein